MFSVLTSSRFPPENFASQTASLAGSNASRKSAQLESGRFGTAGLAFGSIAGLATVGVRSPELPVTGAEVGIDVATGCVAGRRSGFGVSTGRPSQPDRASVM